jgi:hypothetical protein
MGGYGCSGAFETPDHGESHCIDTLSNLLGVNNVIEASSSLFARFSILTGTMERGSVAPIRSTSERTPPSTFMKVHATPTLA